MPVYRCVTYYPEMIFETVFLKETCGENMFAEHSISYHDLETYFYGFSMWENDMCMAWDDTIAWFDILQIEPVNVLYDDIFDEDEIRHLWVPEMAPTHEGYVLRVADSFNMKDFRFNVGKFVRKDHVNTIKHWMHGRRMNINKLK